VHRDNADIAAHARATEPGSNPLVRALVGLLLGLAAGLVAALVTPRPQRARRPGPAEG
jgi:hypothetical protein